jgi:bacteriorhodopsin
MSAIAVDDIELPNAVVIDITVVKDPVDTYIKTLFRTTLAILLVTVVVTFIGSITSKNPNIRNAFTLECAIATVASYFYTTFLNKLNDENFSWASINEARYVDWAITTPLMLLALCTVLAESSGKKITFVTAISILLLDWAMLFMGYLGETGKMTRLVANISGFIPFIALFTMIHIQFVGSGSALLYWYYLVIWTLYGLVYFLPNLRKNLIYNVLDLVAKAFVGIGLWFNYSKILSR